MSSNRAIQIVAVLACLTAFAGFITLSSNPHTPQIETKVSEEQAITILKTRALQDGGGVNPVIVWGGTITNAELNYTSLNWATYFDGTYHTHIYVNETTPKGPEPYWFIDYTSSPDGPYGSSYGGRYIVDADTGAIMLSMEDQGGSITAVAIEPYYSVTFTPDAENASAPISLPGTIVIEVKPKGSWMDSIPVYVRVKEVPSDLMVTLNATYVILRKGEVSRIALTIDSVPKSSNAVFHISALKEVLVETRFLKSMRTYTINVID